MTRIINHKLGSAFDQEKVTYQSIYNHDKGIFITMLYKFTSSADNTLCARGKVSLLSLFFKVLFLKLFSDVRCLSHGFSFDQREGPGGWDGPGLISLMLHKVLNNLL